MTETPCTYDPDLWFSSEPDDQAHAVRICHGCPVAAECANEGRDEEFGIWGGLTPRERHRMPS